MRKVDGLTKKRKILMELEEQSDLFRKIKGLLIFTVITAADFLLSYLEHNALGWLDYMDDGSLVDIYIVYGLLLIGNAVVAVVAWLAYVNIRYIFIPYVCTNIRKMSAIRNYCYIPLTEEEILQKGFKNAREYFSYVCHLLEYTDTTIPEGGLTFEKRNRAHKKKAYLPLKKEDLREMLLVCLALYENNGTLFDLKVEDCQMCSESFRNFVRVNTMAYETSDAYAEVDGNGKVVMKFFWRDNDEKKKKRQIVIIVI